MKRRAFTPPTEAVTKRDCENTEMTGGIGYKREGEANEDWEVEGHVEK